MAFRPGSMAELASGLFCLPVESLFWPIPSLCHFTPLTESARRYSLHLNLSWDHGVCMLWGKGRWGGERGTCEDSSSVRPCTLCQRVTDLDSSSVGKALDPMLEGH
jgi:hypothetical protein